MQAKKKKNVSERDKKAEEVFPSWSNTYFVGSDASGYYFNYYGLFS